MTSFAIGLSRIPAPEFFLYNAAGALLWATVVGTGGYLVGNALEFVLGDIRDYEREALAAIAAIGLLAWALSIFFEAKDNRAVPRPSGWASRGTEAMAKAGSRRPILNRFRR